MQCPKCGSSHIRKNGKRGAKQNHICADCGRQFIDSYSQHGYEPKVKELCLKMYCNAVVLNPATKVHKFQSGKTLNEKIFRYK
jgi:transposase-like protein